jgi:O-antigen/teichoic acid export membrane protein
MEVRPSGSLAIAAATNWAAFAATLGVAFFQAPYLIHHLGDARYGVWCVVEAILAYFTLFDLGIAACLVRYVARHHATGQRDELNRLVSACLVLFLAAAVAVLSLGSALVPVIAPGLERKIGQTGDVAPFMLLMVANLALTLPLSVFPTILDGLQRFVVKSIVRLGFLGIKVGGIVWAMETAPGLWSLAIVFTLTNLLEHAVIAALVVRFLPGLRLSHRLVNRATLREVRGYSVDAFLAMLAGRITVQTGAIVVGGFLTAAAAAHYAVAARLVDMAKNLLRSATTTLTPVVSQREATGDLDGVRWVLLSGTRWVLYLVVPIHLGMLVFGRPFLTRWLGNADYAAWCFPVVGILSATLTLGVAQSVAARILYGLGRLKLFARLALVEAAVNLGLSLALVGPLGLAGVAIAVAVPNVLFCLFVIGYSCWLLKVPLRSYCWASWSRPLAAAFVPGLVWWWATPIAATWGGIALGISLGLVPYAIGVAGLELAPQLANRRGRSPRQCPSLRLGANPVSLSQAP